MANKAVELNVAGQRCRVVTTASEPELQELVALVEDKIAAVLGKGRPVNTQALLLAAIALAHDLKEQRDRATAITGKAKLSLSGLLTRVDTALEQNESQQKERAHKRSRTPKAKQQGDDGSS
ncbi:MAG: cell division protein ZapA [Deltaproteobacteria bacterium]|nr:cell division protein ZapA [Deltaproteobacteria bacterium]